MTPSAQQHREQQRGIALIVVLIMVLLVTVLGIAGVRTLVMQERMSANSLDRTLAMQSAERVLRNAEAIAQAQAASSPVNPGFPTRVPATTCASPSVSDGSPCNAAGLCAQPSPGCLDRWLDTGVTWKTVSSQAPASAASAAYDTDATLSAGLNQQYLIEYLGNNFACTATKSAAFNCKLYRITVRTLTPNTDRALVMLQSTFLTQ